jgi:hypothetical protein
MAEAGIDLYVLFIQENGLDSLVAYFLDKGKGVPENVHWHVLPEAEQSLEMLIASAETTLKFPLKSLHDMPDNNRAKHNEFVKVLSALHSFPCDRCGASHGHVATWGPDKCIAADSLTGINNAAKSLAVGNKPVMSPGEWYLAQTYAEKLLRYLCGTKCHFILTAHQEREIDQVVGSVKVTVSTLGKALAPKIPPMFSDVILTVRTGEKFTWSTAQPQTVLKARSLPIKESIEPGFGQIIKTWKSRREKIN